MASEEAPQTKTITPEEMARVIAFFEILGKVDRRERVKQSKNR
jgi:phage terminase large subunit-like protein